jgi:hypothetical protein
VCVDDGVSVRLFVCVVNWHTAFLWFNRGCWQPGMPLIGQRQKKNRHIDPRWQRGYGRQLKMPALVVV